MDTTFLYVFAAGGLAWSALRDRKKTMAALKKAWKAFENILPQFLVVLIMISVVLAVLDTATISRILGRESGFLGILGASIVGAVTLVPAFVAFPAAAALLEGGAGVHQIAAFVSSLMMVGVVTMPLEMRYFGRKVTLMRNGLAYLFSFLVAAFVGWVVR